jgi:5,10-methylenetetrahydromethanopterin reductase
VSSPFNYQAGLIPVGFLDPTTGRAAALTQRIRFASGVIVAGSRHPLLAATWASTMQGLFGERVIVGLGRGNRPSLDPQGVPVLSLQATGEYADILRRLWRGETVSYDGPAGRYPNMAMIDLVDVPPPPLVFGCFGGEKAMDVAVRHFDGVFLMPFLTKDAVQETIRFRDEAAERHGRDPREVRIIHEVVTAPDCDDQKVHEVVHARALTYLQLPGFGDVLLRRNRWNPDQLEAVRNHPIFTGLRTGVADQQYHRAQLVDAARRLPSSWIEPNAAIGSPEECADRVREFFDLGVDEICLHGASPAELALSSTPGVGSVSNPSPSHPKAHMRTHTGEQGTHLTRPLWVKCLPFASAPAPSSVWAGARRRQCRS